MASEFEFYIRQYEKLAGKTVGRTVFADEGNERFYGLEFTDGTVAWIACDPEGNGPGFLRIQSPKSKNQQKKGK